MSRANLVSAKSFRIVESRVITRGCWIYQVLLPRLLVQFINYGRAFLIAARLHVQKNELYPQLPATAYASETRPLFSSLELLLLIMQIRASRAAS